MCQDEMDQIMALSDRLLPTLDCNKLLNKTIYVPLYVSGLFLRGKYVPG